MLGTLTAGVLPTHSLNSRRSSFHRVGQAISCSGVTRRLNSRMVR
jgi:hypothetical protein